MIYLFIPCFIATLVSANPLAQLLLQTRSNCNQNGYNNVPYSLPIQANNIQNYIPPNMNQNPVNFCSCDQPYGQKNGLPFQIKVEDTNKSYLNKLLANPMFQNILDPNANNLNSNSHNFSPQTNHGQTPNVINNYYIIPSDCLQGNDKGIEIVKNLIENQVCKNEGKHKNTESERQNNQKPQNGQHRESGKPKGNKRVQNNEGGKRNLNNNQPRREKNNANQRSSRNDGNQREKKKISGKNQKVNHERLPSKDNIAPNRTSTRNISNGTRNRKKPKVKTGNDTQITNDTLSTKNKTESKKQTNVLKLPRDDDVIKDIHKKFPGIPKNVIKRLLRYLRGQHQIQKLCHRDDFKSSTESKHNDQENIKSNDNKRKKSENNSTELINLRKTSSPATMDNISVTDNLTSIKDTEVFLGTEVTPVEIDQNFTENKEKPQTFHNRPVTEIIEMTTNTISQRPEHVEEGTSLDVENDVNDYYPDFRFDKLYMSEDDYIRNMRNDRFYYTTDRNNYDIDESSEILYKPYKPAAATKQLNNYSINKNEKQSDEIEDTLNRPIKDYENYDEEFSNNFSSEKIVFHTPPFLEHPDFETKPIAKYFDKERPVYSYPESKNMNSLIVKSSTYSNVKSVNAPLKEKPRNVDIETVFAGSKVAKYGQPPDIEDHLDKNDNPNPVVVYAKSLPFAK